MDNSSEHSGITKIKTLDFSYTWTIHHFSFSNKDVNEGLWSSTFETPGQEDLKWKLSLYPKGEKKDNFDSSDHIGIYLHLDCVVNYSINTKMIFCILDRKRREKHTAIVYYIFKKDIGYGRPGFLSQKILFDPKHDLLPNNTLTILCKVTAGVGSENCCKEIVKFREYKNNFTLISDFESLLKNNQMTDITLVTEGKELKAHKLILAARSPVFMTMLQADMQEKQNSKVKIDDITYDVMNQVLQYIYTGKVKDLKKYSTDLLKVADKYDIKGLKLMCEELFYNELSIDNVIKLFTLADRHNCNVLRPLILKFIIAHAKDVVKTVEFKKFEKDLPTLVKEMIHAVVN